MKLKTKIDIELCSNIDSNLCIIFEYNSGFFCLFQIQNIFYILIYIYIMNILHIPYYCHLKNFNTFLLVIIKNIA
jgi:hypothetical protein